MVQAKRGLLIIGVEISKGDPPPPSPAGVERVHTVRRPGKRPVRPFEQQSMDDGGHNADNVRVRVSSSSSSSACSSDRLTTAPKATSSAPSPEIGLKPRIGFEPEFGCNQIRRVITGTRRTAPYRRRPLYPRVTSAVRAFSLPPPPPPIEMTLAIVRTVRAADEPDPVE